MAAGSSGRGWGGGGGRAWDRRSRDHRAVAPRALEPREPERYRLGLICKQWVTSRGSYHRARPWGDRFTRRLRGAGPHALCETAAHALGPVLVFMLARDSRVPAPPSPSPGPRTCRKRAPLGDCQLASPTRGHTPPAHPAPPPPLPLHPHVWATSAPARGRGGPDRGGRGKRRRRNRRCWVADPVVRASQTSCCPCHSQSYAVAGVDCSCNSKENVLVTVGFKRE